jgi:hypothetical protein
MPLVIKGLKGKAIEARGNLDKLHAAYDKFNAAAPKHVGDVNSLTEQVDTLQSDLEFSATMLGNGTEHSEEQSTGSSEVGHATFSADPSSSNGKA